MFVRISDMTISSVSSYSFLSASSFRDKMNISLRSPRGVLSSGASSKAMSIGSFDFLAFFDEAALLLLLAEAASAVEEVVGISEIEMLMVEEEKMEKRSRARVTAMQVNANFVEFLK